MTIFDIDEAIRSCVDESGEVIDLDKLIELQMERDTKCENLACWVIELNAEAKAIKEQEAILKERREKAEAKAERLKAFLGTVLDGNPMKTSRVAVSFRKSTSVDIADESVLPEEFMVVKTTSLPDKTAIKKAITSGIAVPGCTIVEKNNIQIK